MFDNNRFRSASLTRIFFFAAAFCVSSQADAAMTIWRPAATGAANVPVTFWGHPYPYGYAYLYRRADVDRDGQCIERRRIGGHWKRVWVCRDQIVTK
jgi:hypothetical protein